MTIWVDADACPVVIKEMLYRAAERTRTPLVLVANQALRTPPSALIRSIRVSSGFDEADDYLVDQAQPGDLVISSDIPLAARLLAKEVEVLIQRLTQKARAAGIHLILATQRPSADVITGVIKSNIPSRISFMVESNLNSRIILDEGGAESLLGKGDMLFKRAGALNLVRIQGAFIPDEEVENVVNYVKNECLKQESEPVKYEPIDLSIPEKSSNEANAEDMMDDLLQEASEWVLDTKRASVSALQRRFRIGYTRAGRLMDSMEKMGIVGPAEGAKPREILMTKDKVSEMFMNMENSKEEEQQ